MRWSRRIRRALAWLSGFVREDMPQSSARAVALGSGVTACVCGGAAVVFAFLHPADWQMAAAIGGTTVTALGGVCAVGLGTRKRADDSTTSKDGDS